MKIIKITRKRLGLSQSDFAQLIGVHLNSVSEWERGDKAPSTAAERICRLILKRRRLPQADRLKQTIRSEGGQAALEKLFTAEGRLARGSGAAPAAVEEDGELSAEDLAALG